MMINKKTTIVLAALVSFFLGNAQQVNIVPKPSYVKTAKGAFAISAKTKILFADKQLEKTANIFNEYVTKHYGFSLQVVNNVKLGKEANAILLKANSSEQKGNDAYTLDITGKNIVIASENGAGVFYGIQSLIQLLPFEKTTILNVQQMHVKDTARFTYRGMHLDVGRHFFDVDFIKKYIDLIAAYKLNTFHWHLTEDQGWRIEIKKYPNLTKVGSKRNGEIIGRYPGTGNNNTVTEGFYTQEQVKEVVAYAAARYITVVPEIEMPGHGSAAIAAYPSLSCFPKRVTAIPVNMVSNKTIQQAQQNNQIKFVQETWGVFDDVFCAGKDSTFIFLQNVLDEVLTLFPSKYIHIGGDECPKANWKQCPLCQKRMKENELKDEHALQSYFIQRIEKYLNSKGRQIIGWDEILEGGLAPNATVMSWRGEQGGIEAARQNHQVIMTPGSHCYFDHSNWDKEDSVTIGGLLPVEKVYSYNPVSDSLNADQVKYIIGAQANMWTEYMNNPAKVEYMLLPRLSAMSEVLWTKKENKNWKEFEPRLLNEFKRYDWLGLNYCKIYLKQNNQ